MTISSVAGGICIRCLRQEADLKEARALILELQAELTVREQQLAELSKVNELQEADLARLKALLKGMKRGANQPERVHPDQLGLGFERLARAIEDEKQRDAVQPPPPPANDEDAKALGKKKRRGGRRRLHEENLPFVEERIVPPEVEACGGVGWMRVGEEISERVAYRPGEHVRIRTIREKWVRCDPSGGWLGAPLTAPLPDWALPDLMADTSVIASILLAKYGFALPLHRQEQMIGLHGFPIARSTMSDWTEVAFKLAEPVVMAMHAESLAESYCIATDATSAPVRAPKGRTYHHVFVFISDAGHITFLASRRHTKEAILRMMGPFRGALLSDAAGIYDVVHSLGVTFVACWAHVRRYFWKATLTEPDLAYEALALIQRLFVIERKVKRLPLEKRADHRRAHTQPVIDVMDSWVERARSLAEPGGRLAAGLRYYQNQREALGRFVHDDRLEAHNNACERELRALVLGRKNWMYFENKTGLAWYTVFRSLISSCRLHDLNPFDYLEQMLRLARHWPRERALELSPKYWRATVASLDERMQAVLHPPWKHEQPRPQPLIDEAS